MEKQRSDIPYANNKKVKKQDYTGELHKRGVKINTSTCAHTHLHITRT